MANKYFYSIVDKLKARQPGAPFALHWVRMLGYSANTFEELLIAAPLLTRDEQDCFLNSVGPRLLNMLDDHSSFCALAAALGDVGLLVSKLALCMESSADLIRSNTQFDFINYMDKLLIPESYHFKLRLRDILYSLPQVIYVLYQLPIPSARKIFDFMGTQYFRDSCSNKGSLKYKDLMMILNDESKIIFINDYYERHCAGQSKMFGLFGTPQYKPQTVEPLKMMRGYKPI